jgi:long-chain acyl-CoA synthetase
MQDFRPTFVLAVPRVFEKVYNTARQRAHADGKGAIFDRARTGRDLLQRGDGPPIGAGTDAQAQHRIFDRLVYGKLRAPWVGAATPPSPAVRRWARDSRTSFAASD